MRSWHDRRMRRSSDTLHAACLGGVHAHPRPAAHAPPGPNLTCAVQMPVQLSCDLRGQAGDRLQLLAGGGRDGLG